MMAQASLRIPSVLGGSAPAGAPGPDQALALNDALSPPPAQNFRVGSRLPLNVKLLPVPEIAVSQVAAARRYRSAIVGNRVYLADPTTGVIVADVTPK